MKIAIVHDYLNQFGGAERCVAAMLEAFPHADLYTSFYIPEDTFEAFRHVPVQTSFMQHLPGMRRHYRKYFLLYPKAFEQFDFRGYDVILSSSSAYAKFAIPGPETLHLCYCYTPMRFAWQFDRYVAREPWSPAVPRLLRPFVERLRAYDRETVDRVHRFCTVSRYVRHRIATCYGREADVIAPPVETERFYRLDDPDTYFLVVSRLVAHKRIDIVVEAFNELGLPLKVVGFGPQLQALRRQARGPIEFVPFVDQDALAELYANCRALIVPSVEEFGLAALEAMASGRPVIAIRGGGALETVLPDEPPDDGHITRRATGLFFNEQTPASLCEAITRFERLSFDSALIRSHALQFDKRVFVETLKGFVTDQWDRFRADPAALIGPAKEAKHVAQ